MELLKNGIFGGVKESLNCDGANNGNHVWGMTWNCLLNSCEGFDSHTIFIFFLQSSENLQKDI